MTDHSASSQRAELSDFAPGMDDAAGGSFTSQVLSVVAHRRSPGQDRIDEALLQGLCRAVCAGDADMIERALADLTNARVSPQAICERYIAEAARRLGDAWNDDSAGFAEVTIAMSRLQCLLRELDRETRRAVVGAEDPTALVVLPAGETHTLGALVLSGQLRRRGVSVRLAAGLPGAELYALVEEHAFDMVLVSCACGETLDSLRKLIISLRLSMVCDAPIVVGGATVGMIEDVEAQTGADYTTSDIDEALTLCGLTVSENGARRCAMTG